MSPPLFDIDPGPRAQGRQWTLTIPAPCEWITANKITGTYHRYMRAKLTKPWRQAGCDAAEAQGLPTGLDYVRIDGIARYHGHAPVRDRDNLRPTLKAVIDGLGPPKTSVRKGKTHHYPGYGLIPDDNDRHLAGSDITLERLPGTGRDELVLIIKEILR